MCQSEQEMLTKQPVKRDLSGKNETPGKSDVPKAKKENYFKKE